MEKMPYQEKTPHSPIGPSEAASDWRQEPPVLKGHGVGLRPLVAADAPHLLLMLANQQVLRYLSPSPSTVEGFERFIRWSHTEREAGRQLCFAVVPRGQPTPAGVFQVRQTEPGFSTAEWGFALGTAYWGRGLFLEGAHLLLDYVFRVVGAHRLEARSCVRNARGNGALRKLGAGQEAMLRGAFLRDGHYHDQILWTILDEDWLRAKAVWGS